MEKINKVKNTSIFIVILVIGSFITIIKVFNINIFPISIIWQNITKRQLLDKEWDYEKVINPNGAGYDLWIIGQEAEEVSAAKIASGVTVSPVIFSGRELNIDYKSQDEYYKNRGPENFRNFIKEYYNNK